MRKMMNRLHLNHLLKVIRMPHLVQLSPKQAKRKSASKKRKNARKSFKLNYCKKEFCSRSRRKLKLLPLLLLVQRPKLMEMKLLMQHPRCQFQQHLSKVHQQLGQRQHRQAEKCKAVTHVGARLPMPKRIEITSSKLICKCDLFHSSNFNLPQE